MADETLDGVILTSLSLQSKEVETFEWVEYGYVITKSSKAIFI
jgi:hypothetical protein